MNYYHVKEIYNFLNLSPFYTDCPHYGFRDICLFCIWGQVSTTLSWSVRHQSCFQCFTQVCSSGLSIDFKFQTYFKYVSASYGTSIYFAGNEAIDSTLCSERGASANATRPQIFWHRGIWTSDVPNRSCICCPTVPTNTFICVADKFASGCLPAQIVSTWWESVLQWQQPQPVWNYMFFAEIFFYTRC